MSLQWRAELKALILSLSKDRGPTVGCSYNPRCFDRLSMRIMGGVVLAMAFAPAHAADRELGKHLSSECVACHQLSGRVVAGVPAIVGIDQPSFTAMMESYRKKERPNQVMQSIAAKFNDEEIAALAAFFEGLKKR